MLKDITTIELEGANFRTPQRLSLLSQNGTPVKASLIYGRNGSGKSTIAKAFKVIRGEAEQAIQSASVFDVQGVPITLLADEQAHIFVFDETYINTNVRVQEDGLGSIVMLGDQASLTELIATTTDELHNAEIDRDQKEDIANEFTNVISEKSPEYYIEKMKATLRGNNNWAGRDKKIKGNIVNSSVSDDTYKRFVHLNPEKIRDELFLDFIDEWEKYENAQSGASRIVTPIPTLPDTLSIFDVEYGNALLKTRIEHPELSKREQYLLGLVQSGGSDALRATAQEFELPNLIRCPKCHQPLSKQYKSALIASIQKVLSKEVEHHQVQLCGLQLQPVEMDLTAFQQMEHYQECITEIERLNQIIRRNNALLKAKEIDPYTPINEELTTLSATILSLQTALFMLETDRNDYNKAVTDTEQIKAKLTRINDEIAYYDIIELFRLYSQRIAEKQIADEAYAIAQKKVIENQNRINELNAQRNSIHIAIDVINDAFKYIFFSERRMQIKVDNGVYKLFCNGHAVKPKDVSVGERNIIGLCYFFASILQGRDRDAAYNEEYLMIIDDPISSYDFENRIGILSYLKYQFGKFLLGNIETRVLLLTHDLLTAIDVQKVFEELIAECKIKFNGQRDFLQSSYELSECVICRFNNTRNEYTELINIIFDYGSGGADGQGNYIGNIMRQVMEAFATFEYKKTIKSVFTDDAILETMEHEEDRIHFKNLMYRIVLNEGSHRYNQTRNMQIDFFSMISDADKRRTAKEILCFMYLLNRPHMKAHLGEKRCCVIDAWCEAIRKI